MKSTGLVNALKAALPPSAALAFALLFMTPSILYMGDASSIELPYGNFMVIAAFVTVGVFVLLLLAGLALQKYSITAIYMVLAIAIAVKTLFLPSAVPVLDGEQAFFSFSSWNGAFSILQIIASLALGVGYVMKFGNRTLSATVVVLFVLGLQPLFIAKNWQYEQNEKVDTQSFFTFSKDEPNVLVVVIDTFQSDVFGELLQDDKTLRESLRGFTYFYDTLANAPNTRLAMMPIYSGRTYEGGLIKEFYQSAVTDSIFSDFKNNNYETSQGGAVYGVCAADQCFSRSALILNNPIYDDFVKYIEALEYSSMRVFPTFAHSWIYNGSNGRLRSLLKSKPSGAPPQSVAAMETFARRVELDGDKPTFKFFHIMTTHPPMVLDAGCNVLDEQRLTRKNYKAQAQCAVNGFVGLLDSLKAKGIYDDMTIVLMADHGAFIGGKRPKRKIMGEITPFSGRAGGRFTPLFAVKPPGATGPIKVSSAPVQPSDLRATLCDVAIDCGPNVVGESAFSADLRPERVRRFVDYNGAWAHRYFQKHGNISAEGMIEYTIIGPNTELLDRYDLTLRPKGPE